jgi:hypothetical protein
MPTLPVKRKAIFILSSILMIAFIPFQNVFTNATQPPAGRTGCNIAPTETTCGTSSCHNTTPNTGGGSLIVTFSDPNLKYIPGETYDMTVTTSEAGKIKFGFEITVTDAGGDSVGTFIIPNGTTNISSPPGGFNHRKYLGHKTAGSNNTWSFQWKAPAIDKGQLCFYVAANCANGNNASSGDHIYTTSLCISADSANGIFSPVILTNNFFISSMVYDQITVQYNQPAEDHVLIQLYNFNGELLQTLFDGNESSGLQKHTFHLVENLPAGLYLVRYSCSSESVTNKIFIEK